MGLGVIGVVSACGASPTATPKGGLSISHPVHQANGFPISLVRKRINALNDNPYVPVGEKIYSLMYWSQGYRVQGFLLDPPGRGPFPLEVVLHGGYFLAQTRHSRPHSIDAYTVATSLRFALHDMVVFLPNYRGYGPSTGTIRSGYSDYRDTRNGLAALKDLRGLKINRQVYLFGISLGGYVALQLDHHVRDVRAIDLDSPDPGSRLFVTWLQTRETQLDRQDIYDLAYLEQHLGTNTNSAAYRLSSVSYGHLNVPILMVAGTHDPIFPPGLEREMYQRLKTHDRQPVTLRLVPGGHAPISPLFYQFFQSHIAQ